MLRCVTADADAGVAGVDTLVDELNRLLATNWPFFADRVVTDPGGHQVVPMDRLAHEAELAGHLAHFAAAQGERDPRGVVSLWTQWYAVSVWPALAVGAVVLGRMPPLAPGETGLIVDADYCPMGLLVAPGASEATPAIGLERLARDQAAPLMHASARWGGVAPRVPWSNCANVLGWTLSELASIAEPEALASAYRVLGARAWPDGSVNPLGIGDCCAADTGRPPRRVCCLRYRLAQCGYCSDCPILPAEPTAL